MYSTPPESHEVNRLTVADILSTMASVDAMTPTTLSLLDGLTGVPTRTTPTLTPTTLRNIEQTFMNLAAEQMSHDREAGFVPPLVPATNMFNNNNNSSSASSSSNNYTVTVTTATEQAQMESKSWMETSSSPPRTGRRMSVGSNSSSSNSGYSSTAVSYTSSTRRGGGRRKDDRDNNDGEDTGKKLIRRERNKQAAARCRKRRLDHTMALQQETELWEEKKQTLQNEIRQLQKDKEELEQLLEAHRPQCKVPNRQNGKAVFSNQKTGQALPAMPSLMPIPSALHQQQHHHPMVKEELHDQASEESSSEDPSDRHYQQMIHQQQQRMESFTRPTVAPRQRPTTLSVASSFTPAAPPRASSTWAEIAGIAITTPSSGIPGFNFESLMEGGTGLTPVVPSPSCSTQQQRNNAASILPVDLSSPDASVNRKLVSL